jgi:hypothetical protein
VSVDADHARKIAEEDKAVAFRPVGVDGGVESVETVTVARAVVVPLEFVAVSV